MSSLVERRKGSRFSSSLHGAEPASASSTSDWINGGSLGAVDDEASTLRRTGGPELVQNTKIISWHERVYAWFKGVRLHRCDVYLDNFVCVLVELYDWCWQIKFVTALEILTFSVFRRCLHIYSSFPKHLKTRPFAWFSPLRYACSLYIFIESFESCSFICLSILSQMTLLSIGATVIVNVVAHMRFPQKTPPLPDVLHDLFPEWLATADYGTLIWLLVFLLIWGESAILCARTVCM